jgi:predicted enzyme related to lactoylglutathione lyase
MSKEPEKVSEFYAKLFGWKVTHHPEINYRVVETGAKGPMPGINGGIVKPDREGPWPGNMLFYILVDDLAPYRQKIVAAGGQIHVEEQEVPGMGWLSLFTDPEGRMMGLWKANVRAAKKAAGKPAKKPAKKAGKKAKKK